MKSRAKLLAELEEKRIKNNQISSDFEVLSIEEPETGRGYDPYDNPSIGKEMPDDADITARRREILLRNRGR